MWYTSCYHKPVSSCKWFPRKLQTSLSQNKFRMDLWLKWMFCTFFRVSLAATYQMRLVPLPTMDSVQWRACQGSVPPTLDPVCPRSPLLTVLRALSHPPGNTPVWCDKHFDTKWAYWKVIDWWVSLTSQHYIVLYFVEWCGISVCEIILAFSCSESNKQKKTA